MKHAMNNSKMAFQIVFLLVYISGCGWIQEKKAGPQTEYIFEMDAASWLAGNAARPGDSFLQAALQEMQAIDPARFGHPLDGFAQVVDQRGWGGLLKDWFPKQISTSAEADPMAILRADYAADAHLVMHSMQLRLEGNPSVTIDGQLHVHAVLDSATGDDEVRHFLLAQGELGFYETYKYREIQIALEAALQPVSAIDSSDTVPDLDRQFEREVDADASEALSQEFVSPDFAVALVAKLEDTAHINRTLSSPEARSILPPNLRFAWSSEPIEERPDIIKLIALKTERDGSPQLGGDHVVDARVDFTYDSQSPIIQITMDAEGKAIWARMTRNNLNRQIAIVFDGYVCTYPTVQSEITGGISQITGSFTIDEARRLAMIIKANQYPARVRVIEERRLPMQK
jgi:hypothetical protein